MKKGEIMKLSTETIAAIEQEIKTLNRSVEDQQQAIDNMNLYRKTIDSLDKEQERLLYRATFIKLLSTCDSLRFQELLEEALLEEVPHGKVVRHQ